MKIGEPRKFTVVFIRKKSLLLATIRKILILSMLLFCVTLSYILENIRRLLWFNKKCTRNKVFSTSIKTS